MICGIDPGASGAIAFLGDDNEVYALHDMPVVGKEVDSAALAGILRDLQPPDRVVIEDVHSFPKQGVAGVFRFGQAFGTALGIIAALQLPLTRVTPTTWKKAMGLTYDKERSRRKAIETWPKIADQLTRKRDERRAEAVLLASWLQLTERHILTRTDV